MRDGAACDVRCQKLTMRWPGLAMLIKRTPASGSKGVRVVDAGWMQRQTGILKKRVATLIATRRGSP